MIFLQSIFGYLVVCILYKWSVDWSKSTTSPPSLLNMLIAMFLSPGTIEPAEQLYPGQSFVQVILVWLAAICVPWMLCTKPYFQWKEMKKIRRQGYIRIRHQDNNGLLEDEDEGHGQMIVDSEDMEEERVSHKRSART
jgi:V-type H+-transporting ATPase subunit a